MTLFTPLAPETRRLLDGIPALIDKCFLLPGRFRSKLPADVAELSRLLTSGRGERGLSYLGRPPLLSAYLRFFLPWNLYRLCRLLPNLDINFAAHDRVTDLGCGPLTFAAALWICRPDLRHLPLEFHCIDRSSPALDAGKKFFAALAGDNSPWKIRAVKSELNAARKQAAALVCAVNVFNEMYGDISRNNTDAMRRSAEKSARLLENHADTSSAILVIEPGFPRCGEFISLLREVLGERDRRPLSPCIHDTACPFPGGQNIRSKNRWCHFVFETEDAPPALHHLSAAAGLPKERAVLSFLFTSSNAGQMRTESPPPAPRRKTPKNSIAVPNLAAGRARVISDAFLLPYNRYGRYGCSRQGLILLSGEKTVIERTASGSLVNIIIKNNERDAKSGALIAETDGLVPKLG
ncbi:MAG: rRNA methyltransferase [Treponema sp.]|jgi:hypothetical protein|nr:rRNA methyltransferase [Treponema sp.]